MDFSISTVTSNFNTAVTLSLVNIELTPGSTLHRVTWKFQGEDDVISSTKITKTFNSVGVINYSVKIEDSLGGEIEKPFSLTVLSNITYDMASETTPIHNISLPSVLKDSIGVLTNKVRFGFQKLDKILDIFIYANGNTAINPSLLKNPLTGRWLGGVNKYIEDMTIGARSSITISADLYDGKVEDLDLKLLILDEYELSDTRDLWVTADTVLHTAYDFDNQTIKIINARDIPFKVKLITNLSKVEKPNEIW